MRIYALSTYLGTLTHIPARFWPWPLVGLAWVGHILSIASGSSSAGACDNRTGELQRVLKNYKQLAQGCFHRDLEILIHTDCACVCKAVCKDSQVPRALAIPSPAWTSPSMMRLRLLKRAEGSCSQFGQQPSFWPVPRLASGSRALLPHRTRSHKRLRPREKEARENLHRHVVSAFHLALKQ